MGLSPRSHLEEQRHGLGLRETPEPVEEVPVVAAADATADATGRRLWALLLLAQLFQLGPFLGAHLGARAVDTDGAAPAAWRTCRLLPVALPAGRREVREMFRVREGLGLRAICRAEMVGGERSGKEEGGGGGQGSGGTFW